MGPVVCLLAAVAAVAALVLARLAARPAVPGSRSAAALARSMPGRWAGARRARVVAHVHAARGAVVQDRFADAADHVDAALAEALGSWPSRVLEMAPVVAVGAVGLGDLARATRQLDAIAGLAGPRPSPLVESALCRQRAQVHRLRGEFAEARSQLGRAAAVLAVPGRDLERAMVHAQRSLVELEAGRYEDAADAAEAARRLLLRDGRPVHVGGNADAAMVTGVLARSYAARGQLASAQWYADETEDLLRQWAPRNVQGWLALVRGVVALAAGDPAGGEVHAEAARRTFAELAEADGAEAVLLAGRCRRALGDLDGARRHVRDALAAFERHGFGHWVGVARRELAELG